MNIRQTGRRPLTGEDSDLMPQIGKLLCVLLNKAFGSTVIDIFLPDHRNFHGTAEWSLRIGQCTLINRQVLIDHAVNRHFFQTMLIGIISNFLG